MHAGGGFDGNVNQNHPDKNQGRSNTSVALHLGLLSRLLPTPDFSEVDMPKPPLADLGTTGIQQQQQQQGSAAMLAVLPCLQELRVLQLSPGLLPAPHAPLDQYSALTASSYLMLLSLYHCQLPAGVCRLCAVGREASVGPVGSASCCWCCAVLRGVGAVTSLFVVDGQIHCH